MKNVFRLPTLLALLLFITVLSVFGNGLLGPLAKWGIESAVQKASGLPVTVKSASLGLFPLTLNLKGIEWPDKQDRMENAVSVSQVNAQIATRPLLRGNVIIAQANITGVLLDQPRSVAWEPLPVKAQSPSKQGAVEPATKRAAAKINAVSRAAVTSANAILDAENDRLTTR